jgi:hypothetical protein
MTTSVFGPPQHLLEGLLGPHGVVGRGARVNDMSRRRSRKNRSRRRSRR